MLKILQARLQQYVNRELPDVQTCFRKGRSTRDQITNICWIIEKAREFQKNMYFCFISTSLMAQMVKRLPTMWETWVQSLGWEDPLEEGMATHSSIPAWRISMDREAWQVNGVTKSQTGLSDYAQHIK